MVVHSVSGVQAKKVISYVFMPGIIPRVRALFSRGFGYIAFLMANVYNIVRILPNGHPYLNPANIGKFGIRHVIGEAANNIVFSRKNIDQVIVFVALLSAVVILFLQIALLLYGVIVQPAHATSIFMTPAPSGQGPGMLNDVSFMLLDRVFGVPGVFCAGPNNSACTLVASMGSFPWPFHIALHKLFQFYSMGLLLIGVIIFLYFLLVVVAETAKTGSPFGQRFQNIWVPIRLVVALGLLVPINYGLNSSQYLVLYSAKYGAGFATNTWNRFNNEIKQSNLFSKGSSGNRANPSGEAQTLVAKPVPSDVTPIVQFMTLVHACRYAYWKSDPVLNTGTPGKMPSNYAKVRPYLVKNAASWMKNQASTWPVNSGMPYKTALDFYGNGDIVIRFGEINSSLYSSEKGNVKPWCGDIRIKVNSVSKAGTVTAADQIQEAYFNLVKEMWFGGGVSDALRQQAHRYIEIYDDSEIAGKDPKLAQSYWQCDTSLRNAMGLPTPPNCISELPTTENRQYLINSYQSKMDAAVLKAWNDYKNNTLEITFTNKQRDLGWAGAGTWYNTIAQINGSFIDAVFNIPTPESYPRLMQMSREENRKENKSVSGLDMFTPNLRGGEVSSLNDLGIARSLANIYVLWNKDGANQAKMDTTPTGSPLRDAVNLFFGFRGLYSMLGENTGVHPLAQLTALGKGLVNSAILSFGASTIMGGMMPLAALLDFAGPAQIMNVITSIFSSVAIVGLTAGLILFYVLPFLPFLYFYFAVGTWIMSIFEAMVGAPLWALAHLRLDGEGLSGDAAKDGYFIIFDIFLRPVLSVFGLIAAMVIFSAQVRILNIIWMLVVANITGHEASFGDMGLVGMTRDVVDRFFFTVLYAIIVYMMATASFKLIDKIPDNIIRWMGASASTFSSINEDPTGGLTKYAAIGGMTVGTQMTGALQNAGGQLGKSLADEIKRNQ